MFIHFGANHIIFNMFALYYFGRLNENSFDAPSFLAIYFGSGLLGNLMSLYLLPPTVVSGGASGAIFGLVGSYVAIARQARHMGVALLYAVVIFVQSSGFGVNIIAHLFGLLGGLALGFLFSKRRSDYSSTNYSFAI
jgi:rhomboid protease GluP